MYHLASFSAIALSLAASVSSLVVPRAAPPQGWDFALLESYDVYHSRYMALSCNTKHNTAFFDQCCHPLLATQSLSSRPAECNPNATTPASSTSSDGDDSDLPDCDDDDDDVANSTSTSPLPAPSKAPAPVPVIASPAPVAAPSTDSAVNTGGFATFFYQNNNFGACGQKHSDSDLIAAIDGARYGNLGAKSSLCGRKVKITNTQNKKSVTVTIEDACPTCDNNNSIDLSVGAFQHIADLSQGIVPIDWQFA
ncbi:RlpA-like double-psi beta-barrel-protein domain-containing protein-containing protein [Gymnopilus junonius]|uniref:RlpA-like double-psi beta-barrel-protein domain-containing protein-containing protein n=1 Tax=Gymnopilus junonius TaxID=109634 RepID=A0A9P5P1D6_GYMJU|nr:RlpA-like double-psi beta-barrel-protein domain-containing protein-containing protein [Gymnopilus junonius]